MADSTSMAALWKLAVSKAEKRDVAATRGMIAYMIMQLFFTSATESSCNTRNRSLPISTSNRTDARVAARCSVVRMRGSVVW